MLRCETYAGNIRWQAGERLHHLFERRCDELAADGKAAHLALETADRQVTFGELDARANGIAHHVAGDAHAPPCFARRLFLSREREVPDAR